MYAIIETGGKQYKVQEGEVLKIEKLGLTPGEEVVFDKVIAVSKDGTLAVGSPYVNNTTVSASVVQEGKNKKIIVYKFKAKKGYHKKQGHRQPFTQVKIEKINA
ncbi:MAG: 50S ribosomal protein L21 [Epulopiscium sp.]|nr:50S ribosomal protein L21 [Candidatus Epulonipiscium sp.]